MDIIFIQNIQSVHGVIGLKYFISVTDQIDLYQLSNLFFIIYHQNVRSF